jgi:hypothetical protein
MSREGVRRLQRELTALARPDGGYNTRPSRSSPLTTSPSSACCFRAPRAASMQAGSGCSTCFSPTPILSSPRRYACV